MTGLKVAVGIAVGWSVLPIMTKILPTTASASIITATGWGKARGLINVAVGVLFGMVKNKNVRDVGIIVAGTGIYDLIAVNIPQIGLPMLPTSLGLVDKIAPTATPAAIPAAVSASYATASNPASRIAASYETPGLRNFSGDNPFDEME